MATSVPDWEHINHDIAWLFILFYRLIGLLLIAALFLFCDFTNIINIHASLFARFIFYFARLVYFASL